MMKVSVLYTGAYPCGNVTTHRVHNLCKGLVDSGVHLELLLIRRTEWAERTVNPESEGRHEGVRYRSISQSNVRSRNILLRRVGDIWCGLLAVWQVLRNHVQADVTMVIGPSFDLRLLLPIAAKFSTTRMVLEMNEFPFVTQRKSLWTSFRRAILLRGIFPLYDGFVVISEELAKVVEHFKAEGASWIKIPILAGSDPGPLLATPPMDEPYLLHAGSLYEEKDGVLGILEAFAQAKSDLEMPLKYVVTGTVEGNREYARVVEKIAQLGLEQDVVFPGYLDRAELERYFSHCSLAIINKLDTEQNRYCFATKLADYLSYGIPVIATTVGEAKFYLEDGVNGYLVEPAQVDSLAARVVEAFADPDGRLSIGSAGRRLCEREFNRKYQGRRMMRYLETKLCGS